VCGHLIAGIALSNPSEGVGVFVHFAGSDLCDSPVTLSEESYSVCVKLCVIYKLRKVETSAPIGLLRTNCTYFQASAVKFSNCR
jgi:hypothetical protein